MQGPTTEIEVFADIVCPFAHVGLQRWAQRREELGRHDVVLRVRAWPLEIVNGAPMDADAVAHKVADLRSQVAPTLFARFDPAAFPSTSLPALALTNVAYRQNVAVGEAVALALRSLLFDEGRDPTDSTVTAEVCARFGIDSPTDADLAAVHDDHRDGVARGVVGSPFFFLPDGSGMFCPTLDISRAQDHLAIDFDLTQFDELVAACFL